MCIGNWERKQHVSKAKGKNDLPAESCVSAGRASFRPQVCLGEFSLDSDYPTKSCFVSGTMSREIFCWLTTRWVIYLKKNKKINISFSCSFPRWVINIPVIPRVFLWRIRGNGPSSGCVLRARVGWVGVGDVMVQVNAIFGCEHGNTNSEGCTLCQDFPKLLRKSE